MIATIGRRFRFNAAHWLPGYEGPCANLHGHNFDVYVEVKGEIDEETGMVCDVEDLKQVWALHLAHLDHHSLNEQLPDAWHPPTTEHVAAFVRHTFARALGHGELGDPVMAVKDVRLAARIRGIVVTVWETENNYARVGDA